MFFEETDYASALVFYQRALQMDPGDATLALNVAIGLETIGRATEAIEKYRYVLSLDPTLNDARERLRALGAWQV